MTPSTSFAVAQDIPLVDVAAQNAFLREEMDAAVGEVVGGAQFVGGEVVDAFAREFAAFCRTSYAYPCANGTEALRLAIIGVLGEGDGKSEIITVSLTFAATAEAVLAARYRPVFVDVDPESLLMDLDQLESARTSRTVAVVPVHLYGQMVDMKRLAGWADRNALVVIEDAAQAHGARRDGIGPGRLSAAASFSFYPGKNLGAWGDAGAVVCNDAKVAHRIATFADHGRKEKYLHEQVGWNARMDAIQAAVLRVKLPHLPSWNEARRRVAKAYSRLFSDCRELVLPTTAPGAEHVHHLYVVQTPQREQVRKVCQEDGIGVGVHYPIPLHEQPAFRFLGLRAGELPVSHDLCRRILSLPMFPELTTEDIERVARCVKGALAAQA